ncbi:TPM domain-containing protein [Luteibacter yeojuensis]|uniref:TPM domain-containing protein n=1 Tax=Luteibacter yeojuensis TaxID=345309 RepID=A0A7X5QU88_9GAMM|nr:TPM domain-containing protein [Luteibacter yeojuensis]NID15504.1 hypothetical protein [Luteibacter yeojuensis]
MDIGRIATNLFAGWFQMGKHFPSATLDTIAKTVAEGEGTHRGELRVAIESRLPFPAVAANVTARDRAAMLFSHLRVWDTDENCGVLLYVLLSEHRIEIVADRGIAKVVAPAEWEAITSHMRDEFAGGRYREAVQTGVAEAGALLARHFPGNGDPRRNELPDRPLVL